MPIEIVGGRQPAPYSKAPVWLIFVASAKARGLYDILAAHLNQERGDSLVWPTREILAELMGLKQARAVDPYLRELEEVGAIDIIRQRTPNGMQDKNIYVIHHEPPDGYTGPRSMSDYYRRQKSVSAGEDVVRSSAPRAELGEHTQAHRETVTNTGEITVSPGRPVVRSSAPRSALQRTPVVRSSAPQEEEELQLEEEPPSSPPPHATAGAPVLADTRGGGGGEEPSNLDTQHDFDAVDWVQDLPWRRRPGRQQLDALASLVTQAWADGWTPEALRAELSAELEGVRSLYAVWSTRLRNLPAPPPAAPAAQADRPALPPACGAPDCDPLTRTIEREVDRRLQVAPCPRCNPASPAYTEKVAS